MSVNSILSSFLLNIHFSFAIVIGMKKTIVRDALGWGFILWFIGYALGIIFFMIAPSGMIGWLIMPIGILITLWVLIKKIHGDTFGYYVLIATVWTLLAIIFDYFFLVKVFKPADGYYKIDVYLYYVITFVLPLTVGWRKRNTVS